MPTTQTTLLASTETLNAAPAAPRFRDRSWRWFFRVSGMPDRWSNPTELVTLPRNTAPLYAKVIEARREVAIVKASTYSSQRAYERDLDAAERKARHATVDWLDAHCL
jgi:hypothetical protein